MSLLSRFGAAAGFPGWAARASGDRGPAEASRVCSGYGCISGFRFLSKSSCVGGAINKGVKQHNSGERTGRREPHRGTEPRIKGRLGKRGGGQLRGPGPRKGGRQNRAKTCLTSGNQRMATAARERQPDPREGVRCVHSPRPLRLTSTCPALDGWPWFPREPADFFHKELPLSGGLKDCHRPCRLTPKSLGAGEGRRCTKTLDSAACSRLAQSLQLRQMVDPASLGWAEKQGQALGSEGVPGLRLLGT